MTANQLMSLFYDLQVNFDIQKRMLYHETKDITDVSVIGKWSVYTTVYNVHVSFVNLYYCYC